MRSSSSRSSARQCRKADRPLRSAGVALVALFGLAATSPPDFDRDDAIIGPAVVIDGDTLVVEGYHILLFGIDAPELEQTCAIYGLTWPCGARAKLWLERLVGNRFVRCLPVPAPDDDDRDADLKATCFNHEDLDIAREMISDGLAVPNLDDGDRFQQAGFAARLTDKGLWAGEFIAPDDWRRGRRLSHRSGRQNRQ